jgi:hypothetical protein
VKNSSIRQADLIALLGSLGFVCRPGEGSQLACEHRPSSTLILLPERAGTEAVRPHNLVAVRRHLDENGLMDREAFDLWMAQKAIAAGRNGPGGVGKEAPTETGRR